MVPDQSDILYKTIKLCALSRKKKKCNKQYGCSTCSNCKFEVLNYIDADPRQVRLLMLRAEGDISGDLRSLRSGYIVLGVIILVIGLFIYSFINQNIKFYNTTSEVLNSYTVPYVAPKATAPSNNINTDIHNTMLKVTTDLKKNIDVWTSPVFVDSKLSRNVRC
jgi:hypothetical protein